MLEIANQKALDLGNWKVFCDSITQTVRLESSRSQLRKKIPKDFEIADLTKNGTVFEQSWRAFRS